MKGSLSRRLFHSSACLCIVIAFWFLPRLPLLSALGAVTILFLVLELVRLRVPDMNRWFMSHFNVLLREREESKFTGSSYVLVAAFVSYLAFDKEIAILCVAFLAVGDVAAAIVGQRFGRTKLFGKALEGDLACLFACLAIGLVLCYAGLDVTFLTVAIGAVGATVGQAVQIHIDDNLTLPLLAGVLMTVVPG